MHPTVKTLLCALPIIIIIALAVGSNPQGFVDGLVDKFTFTDEELPSWEETYGKDKPLASSFSDMSNSELNQIKTDWQYRDLLRNIDDYAGKIIFVEGLVIFVNHDRDVIELCTSRMSIPAAGNPFSCAADDFTVELNGIDNWVYRDILQGYVEITGELDWQGQILVKEIKLTCSNC
jgi:hypothetical protein